MTDYFHVLPDVEAIGEWYRGTGLRPYLDALEDSGAQDEFMAEFIAGLRKSYPARPDDECCFPSVGCFYSRVTDLLRIHPQAR